MQIKTDNDRDLARESGRRLSRVLRQVEKLVRPGISALEFDRLAEKLIREGGDIPIFKNQKGESGQLYPASLCVSINDEAVHGIPRADKILQEGDIVGLDIGLSHQGVVTDMATTLAVGEISKEAKKLLDATKEALAAGISAAKAGARVGDIGAAVEAVAKKYGVKVLKDLAGHGVGKSLHEDPYIPNYGKAGKGEVLKAGMMLAIEPIFSLGSEEIISGEDDWTLSSADGSLCAQFEHTIIVGEGEAEVVTK